jgi:hypothetical protein
MRMRVGGMIVYDLVRSVGAAKHQIALWVRPDKRQRVQHRVGARSSFIMMFLCARCG